MQPQTFGAQQLARLRSDREVPGDGFLASAARFATMVQAMAAMLFPKGTGQ